MTGKSGEEQQVELSISFLLPLRETKESKFKSQLLSDTTRWILSRISEKDRRKWNPFAVTAKPILCRMSEEPPHLLKEPSDKTDALSFSACCRSSYYGVMVIVTGASWEGAVLRLGRAV